jgi:hypothetical protein
MLHTTLSLCVCVGKESLQTSVWDMLFWAFLTVVKRRRRKGGGGGAPQSHNYRTRAQFHTKKSTCVSSLVSVGAHQRNGKICPGARATAAARPSFFFPRLLCFSESVCV